MTGEELDGLVERVMIRLEETRAEYPVDGQATIALTAILLALEIFREEIGFLAAGEGE